MAEESILGNLREHKSFLEESRDIERVRREAMTPIEPEAIATDFTLGIYARIITSFTQYFPDLDSNKEIYSPDSLSYGSWVYGSWLKGGEESARACSEVIGDSPERTIFSGGVEVFERCRQDFYKRFPLVEKVLEKGEFTLIPSSTLR